MAKRPPCPPNMPWLTPYLTVQDCDAAADFYQRAFGFEKRFAMPGPDGKTAHAELSFKTAVIMIGPECPTMPAKTPKTSGVPAPVGMYVYCDDVDAMYARATKAGAKSEQAPINMFWGDRMCRVSDPDGHNWTFATNVADFDPTKAPPC